MLLSICAKSVVMDRLQGEQPLSQKNHNQFTDAYDKHMLLRIGKSNSAFSNPTSVQNSQMSSPPRLHIPDREARELPDMAQGPPTNARNMPPLPSPVVSVKDSWIGHRINTTPYSPIVDSTSNLSNSSTTSRIDSDHLQHHVSWSDRKQRQAGRQHDNLEDTHDSGYGAERGLETSRNLMVEGDSFRPALRLGTKRRALSPASETLFQEDRRSSQASSQSTEPSAGQFDFGHHPQRTGSLSSTTSSAFPHSSASSYLLSATSSLTSASTLDFATLRTPTEVTASDPPVRISMYASDALSPARKPPDTPFIAENTNKLTSNVVRPTASRIGPSFICSCCPKKPRRFENEKQLRSVTTSSGLR